MGRTNKVSGHRVYISSIDHCLYSIASIDLLFNYKFFVLLTIGPLNWEPRKLFQYST